MNPGASWTKTLGDQPTGPERPEVGEPCCRCQHHLPRDVARKARADAMEEERAKKRGAPDPETEKQ